eukprot:6258048-Amphidinium_carterae.1
MENLLLTYFSPTRAVRKVRKVLGIAIVATFVATQTVTQYACILQFGLEGAVVVYWLLNGGENRSLEKIFKPEDVRDDLVRAGRFLTDGLIHINLYRMRTQTETDTSYLGQSW